MKSKKFIRIVTMLLCAVLLVTAFPITAIADTGPKASVRIIFENMGDELCYGTLLSKKDTTGPSNAWNGDDVAAIHNENEIYSYATFDYEKFLYLLLKRYCIVSV